MDKNEKRASLFETLGNAKRMQRTHPFRKIYSINKREGIGLNPIQKNYEKT